VTPSGLAGADAFLKQWVPIVLRSPAYRKNGVLVIVFASSATRLAGGASYAHPLRTGALVISRYARAGSTSTGRYTPYSVLRSIEDLFALKPLAHAASARSFATVALPGAWPKAP
jgi:phosphatidylinositol-3-phosphatase